jgi:flagellar biosynthetic protein FliS
MYGRNQYFQTQVKTARPEEILVMLYDGMMTRIERLNAAIVEENPAEASLLVDRLMDILNHLQATLLSEHAPELATHLSTTYETWTRIIVQSRIRKDPSALSTVHEQMADLRDAWAHALAPVNEQAA